MSDEPETPAEPTPISAAVERREDGHLYSVRTGRRVGGAVGIPWTEEKKRAMREAREAAKQARLEAGDSPQVNKRPSKREARDRAVAELRPKALQVLERAIDKGLADDYPDTRSINAALRVIEYSDGKPVQRIEQDLIQKIEYVLSAHEPAPVVALVPEQSG